MLPRPNRTPSPAGLAPEEVTSQPDDDRLVSASYLGFDGHDDLRYVYLLVREKVATSRALYVRCDAINDRLSLRSADGRQWLGGVAPGSHEVLDNGYGRLDVARTRVTRAVQTLSVEWMLSRADAGTVPLQNIYLRAADREDAFSEWHDLGDWALEGQSYRTPRPVGLVLGDAETAPDEYQSFTTTYTDADGATDIRLVKLGLTSSGAPGDAVLMAYNARTNKLYLTTADGEQWMGGVTPGASSVLDNSLVRLDAARTSVTVVGDALTVEWVLSRSDRADAETWIVIAQAKDQQGLVSIWTPLGTWATR